MDEPVAGSCRCAMLAATASAVSGVPSVNFTSLRSVKSQLSPFFDSDHLVASHGMMSPALFFETSDSRYWVATSAWG